MTLGQLAKLLEKLSNKYTGKLSQIIVEMITNLIILAPVTFERNFGEVLKKGVPNLIIVSPGIIVKALDSIYPTYS